MAALHSRWKLLNLPGDSKIADDVNFGVKIKIKWFSYI